MGLLLATVFALCLWIVLWAIDVKSFDALMLAALIVVTAATGRILAKHLPGRSRG